MGVEFCQVLFLHQFLRSCDFSLLACGLRHMTLMDMSVEPALHPCDEPSVLPVDSGLHVLLSSVARILRTFASGFVRDMDPQGFGTVFV